MSILEEIKTPANLKALPETALAPLCGEIRKQLLTYLSAHGGHVGSNLAMVEVTVALHYVFESPADKIVFDVSHQCYTHKLLTGRKAAYADPALYGSVSGFTSPEESEHDVFAIGHTSTAVSLTCGLAKARDMKGERYDVIAVVGDGSLSGGEAFEGLNTAAALNSGLIILVNDNDMSIAENHGGLYQNLRLLRETNGKAECNLFRALGLNYRFVPNGNDVNTLVDALREVKGIGHPVVIHVCTKKGCGYPFAEADRENWHYMPPFDLETGEPLRKPSTVETYENLTRDYLVERMERDPSLVAITAGTPKVLGFDQALRERFASQFVDVGIAEGTAVALASGIAKNGGRPVFGVSSSFLQRAYDQLSQDLALNHSPAVILVFFAGISYGSQTHMGIFDIALTRSIPNLIQLAPTCREEYLAMLDWALGQAEAPVIIRVPGVETVTRSAALLPEYTLPAKYEIVEYGTDVAILALGKLFSLGIESLKRLKEQHSINATLINPRYVGEADTLMLSKLQKYGHKLVVTLEDGVLDGGFGERIARFFGDSSMRVLSFGTRKEFVDWTAPERQYESNGLTAEQITESILKSLG